MKPEIERTLEVYKKLFKLNEMELAARGAQILSEVEKYNPRYVQMMESMGQGAGMPAALIAVLNARTELLHEAQARGLQPGHECASVALPGARMLGQNWDWIESLNPLMFLVDATAPDGHRVLTLTEPGILGKIGMNSAGIGVCLNILPGKPPYNGVPVHILLRSVRDSKSIDEALHHIQRAQPGTSSSILVADSQGRGFCAEIGGSKIHIEHFNGDSPMVRANEFEYLYLDEPVPPVFEDSPIRHKRAGDMVEESGARQGEELMDRVLASRDDPGNNILAQFEDVGPDLGRVGSLASVKMYLASGKMLIRRPNPIQNNEEYTTHSLR